MALKLNIQPDIEKEMGGLLAKTNLRSKTEYINTAIREYNHKIKRQLELTQLKKYYLNSQKENKNITDEFSHVRKSIN